MNTKFRAWDSRNNEMVFSERSDCFYINTKGVLFMYAIPNIEGGITTYHKSYSVDLFAGLQDKNGADIYEGDVIQFSDKYEWHRSPFQSKDEIKEILEDHVKYPYERRVVKIPEDYEWLLSSEIQSYWEVIGNIHSNPELLEK